MCYGVLRESLAEVFRAVVVVVVGLGVGSIRTADLVVVEFVAVEELWDLRLVVLFVFDVVVELLRRLCEVGFEERVDLGLRLYLLVVAQVVGGCELPPVKLR